MTYWVKMAVRSRSPSWRRFAPANGSMGRIQMNGKSGLMVGVGAERATGMMMMIPQGRVAKATAATVTTVSTATVDKRPRSLEAKVSRADEAANQVSTAN